MLLSVKYTTIIGSTLALLSVLMLSGCSTVETSPGEVATSELTKPIDTTNDTAVRNDVQNARTAVQTYIATTPGASSLSAVQVNTSSPAIQIAVTGSPDNYKIVGTNTQDGFTYTFDSSTGSYN